MDVWERGKDEGGGYGKGNKIKWELSARNGQDK